MFNKLLNCACGDRWSDAALLVLRATLGLIFAVHGYDKVFVKGIPGITGFLGSLGFPMPNVFAYILAYGELVVGVLLIVGLLVHWASKFTIVVAIIAFFLVHLKNGFWVGDGGYEFMILIGAAGVAVMALGAGKYSLDALWLKKSCAACGHDHAGSATCTCGCCK